MQKYISIIGNLEKQLLSDTNKLKEMSKNINNSNYDKYISYLRGEIALKNSNSKIIEEYLGKTKILEYLDLFNKEYQNLQEHINDIQKIKELNEFLESFRTHRTYYLNDTLLERFLSSFLNNYSEDFKFKTEFAGQINLDDFANSVNGKKENNIVELKYEKIPKAVKLGYNLGLKKFIIESLNLKLVFKNNYILEIYSTSNMILKTDKIAKENDIKYN